MESQTQKPLVTQASSINNNGGKRSMTVNNSPERMATTITNGAMNDNLNRSQNDGFANNSSPGTHEDENEGAANYRRAIIDLEDTIKDLDVKLNRVLAKQEYEYLKGYNVYVKQKERELRDTINQLSERYNNQGAKDKKLATLQTAIKTIREEQIKMGNENVVLRDRIKKLKTSNDELTSERDFFQGKAKEVKKKNQLLKLAILRLQNEIDAMKKMGQQKKLEEYEAEKSQFFITELGTAAKKSPNNAQLITSPTGATGFLLTTEANNIQSKTIETVGSNYDESAPQTTRKLHDLSLTQQYSNTLMEPSIVSLNQTTSRKGVSLINSTSALKAKTSHKRVNSISTISRYAHIPTENLKFRSFVDALFSSKMTQDDIKEEIKTYMSVLETNYNDTIRDLKAQVERLQKKLRLARSEKANTHQEKTEFEAIFVECIEDVRKEIMKRRLKNELQARKKSVENVSTAKKGKTLDQDDDPASKEFEESLMKLASHAKGRIKYEDFTSKDKFNILDLFVNNEKTLIKIYEALFPHRAAGATNRNLLGSVASVSSTSTTDRTIGRYGYHSGVAIPSPAVSHSQVGVQNQDNSTTNPRLLQFATPGSKLLHTQTTSPSPQIISPNGSTKGKNFYGSRLKVDSGSVTMNSNNFRESSGPRFNQDSGFQLPSIVQNGTHNGSSAQSSLR